MRKRAWFSLVLTCMMIVQGTAAAWASNLPSPSVAPAPTVGNAGALAPAAFSLQWKQGSSLTIATADGMAFVLGRVLYHAGGTLGATHSATADIYASTLDANGVPGGWNGAGTLNTGARASAGVAVDVADQRAYLIGGAGAGGVLAKQVTSFGAGGWLPEPELSQPVNFPAAAVFKGRVYAAGGLKVGNTLVNTVSSSPILTGGRLGTWGPEGGSLPNPAVTQLAATNTCLFAVGGANPNPTSDIYRALFGANGRLTGWARLNATLPKPLVWHGVAVRDNYLYVFGGETLDPSDPQKPHIVVNTIYAAKTGADCSTLGPWQLLTMPGSQQRERMAVAAAGSALYLIGGQPDATGYLSRMDYQIIPRIALTLSNTTPPPLAEGDLITYHIDYQVTGTDSVNRVTITNPVPSNVYAYSNSVNSTASGLTGSVVDNGRMIAWTAPSLPSGDHNTLQYTGRILCTQGTVAGTVYDDMNADGSQNTGEPGRPGVTVRLPADGRTTITDAMGHYAIAGLSLGAHQVTIDQPDATQHTTDLTQTVTLEAVGTCHVPADFGLQSCKRLTTIITPTVTAANILFDPPANCDDFPSRSLYRQGTPVTLTVRAQTGYSFNQWSDDATGNARQITLRMSEAHTVTAQMRACVILNYERAPSGGAISTDLAQNCEGGGIDQYNYGAIVHLTATALTDHLFAGWQGDRSGTTTPLTVELTKSLNIGALFDACLTVTPTVTPLDAGTATVLSAPNCPGGGYTFAPTSSVTIATTPKTVYDKFDQWTNGLFNPANASTTELVLRTSNAAPVANYKQCKRLTIAAQPLDSGDVVSDTAPNCGGDRYLADTRVTLSVTPHTGKTFREWTGGGVTGNQNPLTITMDGDKDIVALFEISCFALTASPDPTTWGTISRNPLPNCPTDSTRYLYGTVVTATAVAAPTYAFSAWGGDVTGLNEVTTVTMDQDHTLVGHFAACYPLTYHTLPSDAAGSVRVSPSNCPGGSGNLYEPGTTVVITGTPSANFTFDHWNGAATGRTPVTGVVMNGSKDVTANYAACVRLTVLAAPSGGGSAFVATPPTCSGRGDTYEPYSTVILTSQPSPYYVFSGWTSTGGTLTSPGAPNTTLILGASAITATANYAACHRLTYNSLPTTDWGTVAATPGPDCGGTDYYLPSTTVTLSATPKVGKTFAGWAGAIIGRSNPVTLTMNATRQVTATFEVQCLPLDYSTDPLGTGVIVPSVSPNCHIYGGGNGYTYGTPVGLTATPQTGWSFVNWSDGATGTQTAVTVTMTVARNVIAHFQPSCFAVNISRLPDASAGAVYVTPPADCPNLNQTSLYRYGTVVTATAAANPHFEFSNWSGDIGGLFAPQGAAKAVVPQTPGSPANTNNPVRFTVTGNRAITANFITACYPVSVSPDPTAGGATSVAPSGGNCPQRAGEFKFGTLITVTATALTGYRFDHWTGGLTGTATPLTHTVTGPISAAGVFTPTGVNITSSLGEAALPPIAQPRATQQTSAQIAAAGSVAGITVATVGNMVVVYNKGAWATWFYNDVLGSTNTTPDVAGLMPSIYLPIVRRP
jgi:hypothetical protein